MRSNHPTAPLLIAIFTRLEYNQTNAAKPRSLYMDAHLADPASYHAYEATLIREIKRVVSELGIDTHLCCYPHDLAVRMRPHFCPAAVIGTQGGPECLNGAGLTIIASDTDLTNDRRENILASIPFGAYLLCTEKVSDTLADFPEPLLRLPHPDGRLFLYKKE